MFKLAGSIVITFAFIMIGYIKCSELSLRYLYLSEMREALSMLRAEIALKKTPIGNAFSKIGKLYNNRCFMICGEKTGKIGAEKAFKHALLETAAENHLKKSDTDALMTLAAGLGKCDLENQLSRIDYTISMTENAIADAGKEKNEKSKMIMHCSLFAGAAVVLIMI